MLVQFSVENFRSFQSCQTLSMAATKAFKEMSEGNTFATGTAANMPRLLHSCAVYGPNASGKSNLVAALAFVRERVINSAKDSQPNEAIGVTPFKLSETSVNEDSEFEVVFIEQGVRYQYGFRCNRTRFSEEWLYAFPKGRPQKWFHRVFDSSSEQDVYEFGSSFKGGRRIQDWRADTRPNALFLSKAAQNNSEQLQPVFHWFQQRLRVVGMSESPLFETMIRCGDSDMRNEVLEFLQAADLSIAEIQVDKKSFAQEMLPAELPSSIRSELSRRLAGKEMLKTTFLHRMASSGKEVAFDIEEESNGTQMVFGLSSVWLDVLRNDGVLVIDELDNSLHALIVNHLLRLLHGATGRAQLLFTTHNTTILGRKTMRRDQIWFMEKNEAGASELYPLSDFSPREHESLERAYLNGRYGGIPFLPNENFDGIG